MASQNVFALMSIPSTLIKSITSKDGKIASIEPPYTILKNSVGEAVGIRVKYDDGTTATIIDYNEEFLLEYNLPNEVDDAQFREKYIGGWKWTNGNDKSK